MRLLCPSNFSGIRSSTSAAAGADVGHDAEVTPNVGPLALHCFPVGVVADGAAVDGDDDDGAGAGATVPPLPPHPDSVTAVIVAASATRTRMSLIPADDSGPADSQGQLFDGLR